MRIGRAGAGKSDTIMILRIDPRERGAKLLSLPRDLWVPIAGTGHSRKINAAVEIGGAPLLIRTIDQNFGIDIHHYVQVDFAAFRGLVEAIDGVPIYFPYRARDREIGLDIRRTGCVTLDPVQALAFVRSRTYEQLIDGEWEVDLRLPDIGRIGRQQAFIRKALSRASERGARNPGTLDRLIDVGLDGITVDQELTAGDLFDLGRRFRSFDPENLETYSLDAAVTPDVVGDADILRLDERTAAPIFDLFRDPGPSARRGRGRRRPGVRPPPRAQRHRAAPGGDGRPSRPRGRRLRRRWRRRRSRSRQRPHPGAVPARPAGGGRRGGAVAAGRRRARGGRGCGRHRADHGVRLERRARHAQGLPPAPGAGDTTATSAAGGTPDTSATSRSTGSTTSTTNPAAREC